MRASLTLDKSELDKLVQAFEDPTIRASLQQIPHKKAMAALVGQAIADNFDKEGPGWKPLTPLTIRASVSKDVHKAIGGLTDEQLIAHEAKARQEDGEPARRILRRTSLLFRTVTTPGYTGSQSKGGKGVSGKNIWKVEGNNLIWGTDLIYAGIHNTGGVITPKKAKALAFPNGQGGTIFAKKVTIPKREFMVIREEWRKQLEEFMLKEAMQIIQGRLGQFT